MQLTDIFEQKDWDVFKTDGDVYGVTNFSVPKSGPALMSRKIKGYEVNLSLDPDGELGPKNMILVSCHDPKGGILVKKFQDTPAEYAAAKRYAEKKFADLKR